MAGDPIPSPLEPMLAKAVPKLPSGEGWAYELKWDGVRAFAIAEDGEARIVSRRGEDLTRRYPELASLAEALEGRDAALDGEIVAFGEDGKPSFQLLQRRMGLTTEGTIRRRVTETPVTFVAFDVLWVDGRSLLDSSYEERRQALADLELGGAHWQAPRHHVGDAEALAELVRERNLEGIVAKRLGSAYRPGRRSGEWLKWRHRRGQELVIGGYMPGEGVRAGRVGSLLVGHWDATPEEAERLGRPQRLAYAGGVGTGFTEATLAELTERLEPLRRETSPFELGWDPRQKYGARARERGGLVWAEPELVCEVHFTEWTHEGTLRQPAFKGLRDDKDPREVVRES